MKIALAQINPTVGAFEKNAEKILSFVSLAKKEKAELVIFPELSLMGYPPLDLLDKEHFVEDNLKMLEVLVQKIDGISAIIGYVEKNPTSQGKRYFNASAFVSDRKIVSKHFKTLLPSYDVFDETRHFEPAHEIKNTKLYNKKFGITICEDIWNDKDYWRRQLYKQDPLDTLAPEIMNFIVNISASPFSLGKQKIRTHILKGVAAKYKTPVIFVNQVGGNDSLIFDGASCVLNAKGDLIAQCSDFKEDLSVIDMETNLGDIHTKSESDIESLCEALILGIRDYVHKCNYKKVLIGLSGGIDSAVAAVLAAYALGKENVIGLLLPSRYSSKGSMDDALSLIDSLGITYKTISIEPMFESYLQHLKPLLKNKSGNVTEENIQARIRGNILMAFSNEIGALVISTGNKSEIATGYCTLYGDMTGGLSPLSDVPKTWIYKLASYCNRKKIVIPENSITKPPSAELRFDQTDQDTLPPYDILDKIISAYIEEHLSPTEIVKRGFDKTIVEDIIQRIDQNEYKRRQSPMGLRVTHKAFGIGRRLPIAQQYKATLY